MAKIKRNAPGNLSDFFHHEWADIPGFSRYIINRAGVIIDLERGQPPYKQWNTINMFGDDGKWHNCYKEQLIVDSFPGARIEPMEVEGDYVVFDVIFEEFWEDSND